jgi:hypothetical protein
VIYQEKGTLVRDQGERKRRYVGLGYLLICIPWENRYPRTGAYKSIQEDLGLWSNGNKQSGREQEESSSKG